MGYEQVRRFEKYALRPLDLALMVYGVWLLFHRFWLFGLWVLFVSFIVGIIGQGLPHRKRQTAMQLATGPDEPDGEVEPYKDKNAATTAMGRLCFLLMFASAPFGFHFGLKWYLALLIPFPVAVLSGVVIMALAGLTESPKRTSSTKAVGH